MGNIQKILAENVTRHRKDLDWTQEKLAERADLSLTTIAYIETRRQWIALESVRKIAKALGVDEVELFADASRKPTPKEAAGVLAGYFGVDKDRKPRPVKKPAPG